MKAAWHFFIVFGLLQVAVKGQDSTVVQLQTFEVVDFLVEPDLAFKVKQISVDSLNLFTNENLAEILKNRSGIFVKSYGGNGVASLSMRGTGASHTLLNWNGLEISSPTLGQADYSLYPAAAADELSIRYGLASLIDGSGGLGGSLRMNNRVDWKNKFQLKADQQIGSFGMSKSFLQVATGTAKIQSSTRLYYNRAENDFPFPDITRPGSPVAYLQNASMESSGVVQLLSLKPDDDNLLSAKIWYNKVHRNLPGPISSAYLKEEVMDDEQTNAILSWDHENQESQFVINMGLSALSSGYQSRAEGLESTVSTFSWQSNGRYRRHFFQQKLEFEAGANFSLNQAKSSGFQELVRQNRSTYYLTSNYHFTKWLAANFLIRQQLVEAELSPLLGSVGAVFKFDKNLFKLSAARNYRYPSLNDLYWSPGGNPNLQTEQSWNLEMGYVNSGNAGKIRHNLELTAFRNFVDNWIMWTPAGNYWSPQNIKKVTNSGVEVDASVAIGFGEFSLTGMGSYSYTISENKEFYLGEVETVGKQLIYVPYHKLSIGVRGEWRRFSIGYLQAYTGKYYISSDNLSYMPAYSVADVSIGYKLPLTGSKHKLMVSGSINNLFNYAYQTLPYRPEMGVNYFLKLSYGFSK